MAGIYARQYFHSSYKTPATIIFMTHWKVTPSEAIQIQKDLRQKVQIEALKSPIRTIAGADISFNRFDPMVYAGIVTLSFPELQVLSYALVKAPATFPYIPGLLSFREIPALMQAWNLFPEKPDLVMVDGQGIAHPRRLGIATHFGLETGVPTIGCGKSPLLNTFTQPSQKKGSIGEILHEGEQVGVVLRTKDNIQPLFISPGNNVSIDDAQHIVLQCIRKHRLPEPTRQAHLHVNRFRKGELKEGIHILDAPVITLIS